MAANDYLGSFAQENVDFITRIVRTASVGQNYWTTMIFTDTSCIAEGAVLIPIAGTEKAKSLVVTANDFSEYTTGLLQGWLTDLFASGNTNECYIIVCDGATSEAKQEAITEAYNLLKAYAYHKTALFAPVPAEGETSTDPLSNLNMDMACAVKLGQLMKPDYGLLSGVLLLPYCSETPQDVESDVAYKAIKDAGVDAFFSAQCGNVMANASLYTLGMALSMTNDSGTCVGNSFDMWATSGIQSSGVGGTTLVRPIRKVLNDAHIQTWKPVGNNTGNVAAEGAVTLNGDVYPAIWIKAYITYMCKVNIAVLITQPNFMRNASNYGAILTIMNEQLSKFVSSGRLRDLVTSAPAFGALPESETEIVIDNAWSATYVDNVRKVTISGTLYIGADVGLAA